MIIGHREWEMKNELTRDAIQELRCDDKDKSTKHQERYIVISTSASYIKQVHEYLRKEAPRPTSGLGQT